MKKLLVIISAIMICFTSCSVDDTIIIDDIESYQEVWNLTGCHVSKSILFPESIDDLDIVSFRCEWNTYFLDESFEVILSVQYNEKTFEEQEMLISNIKDKKKIKNKTELFNYPAYVTIMGEDCTCEYVLLDEDTLQMHYIYLQFVDEEDIDFNSDYLPKGYNFGEVKGHKCYIYSD